MKSFVGLITLAALTIFSVAATCQEVDEFSPWEDLASTTTHRLRLRQCPRRPALRVLVVAGLRGACTDAGRRRSGRWWECRWSSGPIG